MVPKKRETNERMSNNFNKGNKSSRSLYSIESHNQTSHAVYHENCKLLGLECTHIYPFKWLDSSPIMAQCT